MSSIVIPLDYTRYPIIYFDFLYLYIIITIISRRRLLLYCIINKLLLHSFPILLLVVIIIIIIIIKLIFLLLLLTTAFFFLHRVVFLSSWRIVVSPVQGVLCCRESLSSATSRVEIE